MMLIIGVSSTLGSFSPMKIDSSWGRVLSLEYDITLKLNWGFVRFMNGSNDHPYFQQKHFSEMYSQQIIQR